MNNTSRTLASYAEGRDNNFNLIRFVAASLVLFSHSYALTGNEAAEPLNLIGFSMGALAVHIFFFTSGYLVFASLLRSGNVGNFALARALRIYPALIVMNLVTVFVIGLYFTTEPRHEYLTNPDIYSFIKRNSQLFFTSLKLHLPGLFANLPYPNSTNGSLWTLRTEVTLYAWLALIGAGIAWLPNYFTSKKLFLLFSSAALLFFALPALAIYGHGMINPTHLLRSLFFAGAAYFVLKDKIVLNWRIATGVLVALIALITVGVPSPLCFAVSIGYLTLYLSYVPAGWIRGFNRLGDYSYGIYIYAWPMQQSVATLFPGISTLQMSAIAFPATLCCAMLSWHFIEKPSLGFKRRAPTPVPPRAECGPAQR